MDGRKILNCLKKHKLDVFRLLQIVPDNAKVKLRGLCMEAVQRYIDRIGDEEIRLEQIGLGFTKEQAVVRLRDIYGYS